MTWAQELPPSHPHQRLSPAALTDMMRQLPDAISSP